VPLPKVKAVSDSEVFKVVKSGKTKSNKYKARLYILFDKLEFVFISFRTL
jgi:hypothetical protein